MALLKELIVPGILGVFGLAYAIDILGLPVESTVFPHFLMILMPVLGVLIMVRPGSAGFDWGALLALGMAAGIALASSTVKRFPEGEAPFAMLFWFTLSGTLLTVVPAALVWRAPNLEEWLLLMVMSSLGAAAQFLIIKAYKAGEATFVAPFDYAKLLIGGLLGYFVFAEVPDLWTLLGAAVIVASTVYIARREARAAPPKDAAPLAPIR